MHCQVARQHKYNEEKRLKASIIAHNDRTINKWINSTLEPKFEEVSLDIYFRSNAQRSNDKAFLDSNRSNCVEVNILQKIFVRENLLMEIRHLLQTQNDITHCLNEIIELVKAVRFQTVDIVEDIHSWQLIEPIIRAFLFKGTNYLLKIFNDLDFLDYYDEIVESFGFEFKENPMAYREGERKNSGFALKRIFLNTIGATDGISTTHSDEYVDGIEAVRLHKAVNIIRNELNRVSLSSSNKTSKKNYKLQK